MVSTSTAATVHGPCVGTAPAGWSLKQLKWAITFQRGHDLPAENRNPGHIPVLAGGGITGWHDACQAEGPGIVTGRYGTIGEFHLVKQDYWPLNTALYSIDLHGNHAPFLRYMLEPLAPLFHLNAAKSAVPGIDRSDIHTIPVTVPPLPQQRAIADYLDRETARLDALVAAKERLLGLLAEKRRALITHAVTRGLDSHVPLRDTGIPWLGEIPVHWKTQRLKFQLHGIEQGWSPQCETVSAGAGDWGVLKAGCVNGDAFNAEENKRLPDWEMPLPELEVHSGDVLMSRANTTELLGSVAIVRNVRPRLLLCDKLYRLDANTTALLSEFLVYFLRTPSGRFDFERTATGASNSMQNISQDVVRNVWVPVPPLDEQQAVVENIARATAKLDNVRVATERTIALLKERRAALIAAAVTGQIDLEVAA